MTEHPHYNKELLEKVLNWYTDYLCENISQSNRTVIRTLGYFRIHEKLIDNVRKISVRFRPLDSIRNYLANKGAATVKHEKKKTITIVEECE